MYYIRYAAINNNHGNPTTHPFAESVILPDALLSNYISMMGFCELDITDGVVTALIANTEAIEAYNAAHTESIPTEPVPTPDEDRDAMLVDLEYRVTLLELGVNE